MARKRPRLIIPADIREAVFERDEYQCQYCRRVPSSSSRQIDHIIPYALRRLHHLPHDDPDTLVTACRTCNELKGTLRLVPYSKRDLLPSLPSTGWRLWDGDPATRYA